MSTFLEIDESAVARTSELLKRFQQPNLDRVLQRATSVGARVLVAPIRRAAPVKRGGGKVGKGYGEPGDLAKSVRVARVRRTAGVAAVVGPMGRRAFTRYWVIFGTKPHRINARAQAARANVSLLRAAVDVAGGRRHTLGFPAGGGMVFRASVQHPGARANPFVARGAAGSIDRVRDRMVATILRAAQKAGIAE